MKYGFYGESWDPTKYGDAYVMGEAGEGTLTRVEAMHLDLPSISCRVILCINTDYIWLMCMKA